jgi:hypothetical protein
MDKLRRYRAIIRQALTERADLMRSQPLPGEEIICLLDEATDNYLLLRLGWLQGKRLYSVTLHLRLAEGKIQVEQDWTDDFLAELVAAGVPRAEMVLAFTPPELRAMTEYAVA